MNQPLARWHLLALALALGALLFLIGGAVVSGLQDHARACQTAASCSWSEADDA